MSWCERHAERAPFLAPSSSTDYWPTDYWLLPLCVAACICGCFTETLSDRYLVNRRFRAFRLLQIQGKLGDVAYEMTRTNFAGLHPVETRWQPAVNVFLCSGCLRICADLAGVDPEEVELSVNDGKLLIRGYRRPPEPSSEPQIEVARTKSVRVLAMEIDYGGFAREISLPDDVELDRVKTHWDNGILWIDVPRLSHA